MSIDISFIQKSQPMNLYALMRVTSWQLLTVRIETYLTAPAPRPNILTSCLEHSQHTKEGMAKMLGHYYTCLDRRGGKYDQMSEFTLT